METLFRSFDVRAAKFLGRVSSVLLVSVWVAMPAADSTIQSLQVKVPTQQDFQKHVTRLLTLAEQQIPKDQKYLDRVERQLLEQSQWLSEHAKWPAVPDKETEHKKIVERNGKLLDMMKEYVANSRGVLAEEGAIISTLRSQLESFHGHEKEFSDALQRNDLRAAQDMDRSLEADTKQILQYVDLLTKGFVPRSRINHNLALIQADINFLRQEHNK